MAAETIDFTYIVDGNTLTITPSEPIQDSSQYIISIKRLQAKDDEYRTASDLKYTVTTKLSPMYCSLQDLSYLVDVFNIPEETIMYFIREASKYADYMMDQEGTTTADADVTFAMRQFVRVKTTLDCLLRAYIKKASGIGEKGKLGVIEFQDQENYSDAFGNLLDELKSLLKTWGDALKGYEREGRAKPRSAKRFYKQTEPTTFSNIVTDLTRDMPSNT